MKQYLVFILLFAVVALAHSQNRNAVEVHFDKNYAMIAATDLRVYIELRSYDKDRLIHNVVRQSRYMAPEFEIKDIALDDSPEFLVRTSDGGTGIAETHLTLYCVVGEAAGFVHKVTSLQGDPKRAEKFFPHVHLVASLLKRWLLSTHQGRVEKEHLQAYLDEYAFRLNRRRSIHAGKIFHRLMEQMVIRKAKTYWEIVDHGKSH